MRDYAELVKALRYCATADGCLKCHRKNFLDNCSLIAITDAADAIEELVAAVPKWISAEQRLPGKDDTVFVCYEWTGQSGTVYKEVSLSTLDEIQHFGFKLIAWMPLPEPPKEDDE